MSEQDKRSEVSGQGSDAFSIIRRLVGCLGKYQARYHRAEHAEKDWQAAAAVLAEAARALTADACPLTSILCALRYHLAEYHAVAVKGNRSSAMAYFVERCERLLGQPFGRYETAPVLAQHEATARELHVERGGQWSDLDAEVDAHMADAEAQEDQGIWTATHPGFLFCRKSATGHAHALGLLRVAIREAVSVAQGDRRAR